MFSVTPVSAKYFIRTQYSFGNRAFKVALQTCVKLQNVHFRFRQSCKNAAETYLSAGVIFVFSRFTFYFNFAKDVSPTIFRLIGDFDPFSDLFDHRSLFRPFSDLSDLPGHPVPTTHVSVLNRYSYNILISCVNKRNLP